MLFDASWGIFCINLDRRVDRWAEAKKEAALCGLPHVERISAIEMENRNAGCTISHRGVWQRIADGACERALILEDDFQFITRDLLLGAGYTESSDTVRIFDACPGATLAERLDTMWPDVPAFWDVVYLGGGYQSTPRARIGRHAIRNNGMLTTHAYCITRDFAKRITAWMGEHYPGISAMPPDTHLYQWTQEWLDMQSYTLSPRLFTQRATSQSDISPQAAGGFPWSLTDPVHEMMV